MFTDRHFAERLRSCALHLDLLDFEVVETRRVGMSTCDAERRIEDVRRLYIAALADAPADVVSAHAAWLRRALPRY